MNMQYAPEFYFIRADRVDDHLQPTRTANTANNIAPYNPHNPANENHQHKYRVVMIDKCITPIGNKPIPIKEQTAIPDENDLGAPAHADLALCKVFERIGPLGMHPWHSTHSGV